MITPAVLFDTFAGRSEDLDAMTFAFDRMRREGTGAIVFIEGEAGIGKSRLLAEFERVRNSSGEVCVVRCERYGGPYGPLARIVDRWRERPNFANNETMRRAARAAFAGSQSTADGSRDESRRRAAAIVRAVELACERAKGLALVFDDAHWSDYATADAFAELAELAMRKPLMLVCAYRVSDLDADARLAAAFTGIAAMASRIELDGLSPNVVLRLVREAAPAVDAFTAKRVCDLAEGNPYVAEELTRSMLESRANARSPFDVPRSLRSAILSRVDGLSETARAILEAASIFANDIDAESLPHVCGRNVRDVDESLAAASLAQLIEPVDARKRTFRFRHALAREVVYRSLIVPQSRALHGRLADYLDACGDDVAALAYHRWSARDTRRGAAACEASGDRAMSLASTADAAVEYACALELASGDLDTLERIASKAVRALYLCGRGEDAAGVCLRIASKLERSGRHGRAAAMRLAAVNAAHWAGRADDAAAMLDAIEAGTVVREDASLRAEVVIARARMAASAGDRAALRALLDLRGTLSLTPLQDVRLALFAGLHAYLAGDFGAMERASRASLERTEALGLHDQSIVALSNLGVALDRQGKAREATPFLDRSVAVARELGDLRRLEIALANRVDLAIELGDLGAARERLAEAAAAIELSFTGRRLAAESYFARVTGADATPLFEEFCRLPAAGQSMLFGPCAANLAWCFAIGDARQRRFFAPLADAGSGTRDYDAAYLYTAASLGSNAEAAAALSASASLAGGAPRVRAIGDLVAARAASRRGADRRVLARRAASVFERMGYVVWHAHALDLAGETRRAVALLRRHEYGAEADRLANGIAHAAAEHARTPLSSREREIARLVARGLTNREIGERLGVAHRTVESHVQNAFRKLGVNSRMQLARIADESSHV